MSGEDTPRSPPTLVAGLSDEDSPQSQNTCPPAYMPGTDTSSSDTSDADTPDIPGTPTSGSDISDEDTFGADASGAHKSDADTSKPLGLFSYPIANVFGMDIPLDQCTCPFANMSSRDKPSADKPATERFCTDPPPTCPDCPVSELYSEKYAELYQEWQGRMNTLHYFRKEVHFLRSDLEEHTLDFRREHELPEGMSEKLCAVHEGLDDLEESLDKEDPRLGMLQRRLETLVRRAQEQMTQMDRERKRRRKYEERLRQYRRQRDLSRIKRSKN